MKKLIFLFSLLVTSTSFSEDLHIQDMSGGMWSYPSANKIPDNSASSVINFYTDIEPMITERNGYVKKDSTQLGNSTNRKITGVWNFTDNTGNEWFISFSSRTFYKNTLGTTPLAFGLVATVNQQPTAAKNLGKIWFSNGADYLWWFDGTSTGTVSSAPIGRLVVAWRNRIAVGNINGAFSTIKLSADGDGTSWTLGPNPTDAFNFQVGGANDGQYVRCMWGSYFDNMIISRKYDTWALSGFDQADAQLRNISSEVGCIEPGTMKESNGSLIWLSARGLEEMQGTLITSISDPIRDITDVLVKNTVNLKLNVQSSQSDWQAGTVGTDLSTTISAGDLQAKTTSYSAASALIIAGTTLEDTNTRAYVDTTTSSGNLQLTFPDTFSSYRNGTSGTKPVWLEWFYNFSGAVSSNVFISGNALNIPAQSGSTGSGATWIRTVEPLPNFISGTTYHFEVTALSSATGSFNLFGIEISSEAYSSGHPYACCVEPYFKSDLYCAYTSTTPGQVFGLGCNSPTSDPLYNGFFPATTVLPMVVDIYISTTTFLYSINGTLINTNPVTQVNTFNPGNPVYIYFYMDGINVAVKPGSVKIDNFGVAPETITLTSKTDTGIVSPIWGGFVGSKTDNGGTATFYSSVSSDDASYDADVVATSGSTLTSAKKRYIKLKAKLSLTTATNTTPTVQSYSFNAGSSGTFVSQLLTVGTLISSWNPVTISDVKTGGDITYQIGSTGSASVGSITNWQTVVNGSLPTIATNTYAAFRILSMYVTSGTGTVKTSDFTISWNEGGTPSPISYVYDKRYWVSVTTNTGTNSQLDYILVYQRNKTFTTLKGINAASFTLWYDKLYFGNSNGTGYVYQFDVGNNDDGSSINSELITKAFDVGMFHRDKDFRQAFVSYLGDTACSGSFDFYYDVDRFNSFNSLGSASLSESTGQTMVKFPFTFNSNPVQGREIRFKVVKNGTGDRLKLYDILTEYEPMETR